MAGVLPTEANIQMTDEGLIGRDTSGAGMSRRLTPVEAKALLAVSDGADGNTVHNGAVAPATEGVDGDFYINTAIWEIHGPKSAGVWGSGTSLVGPAGADGVDGADGVGVPAGGTAGQVLSKIDGTDYNTQWVNQSGGSPGGSSGQLQYNNAGAFGGTAAIVYAASGTHLNVTTQSVSDIACGVTLAASHAADIYRVRTSGGNDAVRIYSNGSNGFALWLSGYQTGGTGRGATLRADPNNGRIYLTTDIAAGAQFDDGCTVGGGNNAGGTNYNAAGPFIGRSVSSSWVISHGAYFSDTVARSVTITAADAWTSAVTNTTGGTVTIAAGSGGPANSNGGSTVLCGGKGRGTGVPGAVLIQTATATTSGTTLHTLRDAMKLDGNTTSGETPLLLLDIDKGTLQRVSIGASDSGGTGYKVLRVPN